ncbi:hydrolase [Caballeronia sp. BR00000012568055]|uniref:hydrolase n=1 Tax=Caballeronia sp. BR00000012568055 TaxID=2918761 RepID=UPI0023F9AA3F|nr:hydrolase [Caballeronia sp. BR00000012568055]
MNAPELKLDTSKTALVLIDLQAGIAALPVQTHTAAEVLANARLLADRFRAVSAPVVLVRVAWPSAPGGLRPITDSPQAMPETAPAGWMDPCPELGVQPSDIVVIKRQWGAFYGTDLDLHLRRRGIDTIVLAGISTSIGVDSTARGANERGYQQIFVEDAMADLHADMHDATCRFIFPRIGRIRSTQQVLSALA